VQPGTYAVQIHHPQGRIAVEVGVEHVAGEIAVTRASLIRTARKIFEGTLHLNTRTQEYA
jgi:2-methylaconitate cis-trans-isomerase PrpF